MSSFCPQAATLSLGHFIHEYHFPPGRRRGHCHGPAGALDGLVPRLAPGARVYVESPGDIQPVVPPDWVLHREGRTREVRYALYRAPGHHATVTLRADDPPATTE